MRRTWLRALQRSAAGVRGALASATGPAWLPILMLFLILYGPFLKLYLWKYREIDNTDLPSFHAASWNVFRRGFSPYDFSHLQVLADRPVYPYFYPPPSLLLLLPLAALTYPQSRVFVLIMNHLLILMLVWAIPLYLLRISPRRDFPRFALSMVYSLTFYPFVLTLRAGQVNVLLLAFLVLFWLLAKRGQAVWAGLCLALAVLLKIYPVIIVPLLFVIRRRREAAWTVAWLGLAALAGLGAFPLFIWRDWLREVVPAGGYGRTPFGLFQPGAIWNQSLNGFFARLFTESGWGKPLRVDPVLGRVLTYATAGAIAGVSALAAWRSCAVSREGSLDRTMLLALPCMYLIAPWSWDHHLAYLLPSILFLLNSRCSWGVLPRTGYYAAAVASAVATGLPELLRFKFYAVAVLWGLGVLVAWARGIELPNGRNEGDGK